MHVGQGTGLDQHEALLALQSLLHPSATPHIRAWEQSRYECLAALTVAHSMAHATSKSIVPLTVLMRALTREVLLQTELPCIMRA